MLNETDSRNTCCSSSQNALNSDDEHENGSTAARVASSPIHDTNSSDVGDAANSSTDRLDGINMSHEDLSDVSDLDSAVPSPANIDNVDGAEKKTDEPTAPVVDLRQRINERKSQQKALDEKANDSKKSPSIVDELNDIDKRHKNDEDALDFEAEDGECADEKDENPPETKPEGKIQGFFFPYCESFN